MITPAYAQMMSRYSRWQNDKHLDVADTMGAAARQQDRGAFFRSIQGTLNHLLWGDRMWMSRFDGWEKPATAIGDSAELVEDWTDFVVQRRAADERIIAWADGLNQDVLDGDLVWLSGLTGKEMRSPMALCVVHLFNHQTHHRGQLTDMLAAAGVEFGSTDLAFMPHEMWP